LKQSSFERCF